LGGALFFAISPYAIEFGQEAALYGLTALLTTSTLALGWRWLRTSRGIAAYTVVGILAIYSHYVVAVIVPLFAALILLFNIRDKATGRRWIIANGLILLSWLPWLIALLTHWLNSELPRASIMHPTTVKEVVGGVIQFTSGTAALLQDQRPLQIAGLALGLILLVASFIVTSNRTRKSLAIMFGLFSVIYVLPALVSRVNGMWLFVPHFMLFLLPASFVCLCGLLTTIKVARTPIVQSIALLAVTGWLVVQCWGIVLYNRYPPHGADGLRELAIMISREGNTKQQVFVTPPALMPMLAQYYAGELVGLPEDFDLRRVYIPFEAKDWYDRSVSRIHEAISGQDSFWLVYRPDLDDGGHLLSRLRAQYQQEVEQRYLFSDLYRFSVKP
ncbi:MAG: hypothetical protein ABIQ44_14520, partial [Chloroflexia bacterium]